LISIPKDIRQQFHISEGDILEIKVDGDRIVIEPCKLVPSSQAYFWMDKTQTDMKEAKADVESGQVREFTTTKEFLEGLGHD